MKWIWDAIEIGKGEKLEKVFDKSRYEIKLRMAGKFNFLIGLHLAARIISDD